MDSTRMKQHGTGQGGAALRLALLLTVAGVLLGPAAAGAYPWMIRHHYASCASCHVDPSGGGQLSAYGRAQSELLVAAKYRERGAEEEVSPATAFLLGAVPLPEGLDLGLSFRGGALVNHAAGTTAVRPVQMASDVRAAYRLGQLRAGASLGFAMRRALPASLTRGEQNNVVSREHWLGVEALEAAVLVRAGRLNLPFGLRTVEHIPWVRQRTRTDLNDTQQHGLSVAFNAEGLRSEVMAIVGNLQLQQEAYRERGYAGYLELHVAPELALGVSSLVTQARMDVERRQPFFLRQAHGLFGRWAPVGPLVLMGEADVLLERPQGAATALGLVGMLQADWELVQGVHLLVTGEGLAEPDSTQVGGWLSAAWFIEAHTELRVDAIYRQQVGGPTASPVLSVLTQLHVSL